MLLNIANVSNYDNKGTREILHTYSPDVSPEVRCVITVITNKRKKLWRMSFVLFAVQISY